MEEIVVVDKPQGWTSHDVVAHYRKKLGLKKIGHAGTLDPFATGVLILLVGNATKRFEEFKTFDKEYELVVEFGWATDTGDPEGKTTAQLSPKEIDRAGIMEERVRQALESFRGPYEQTVPAYSAVKLKGQPLYKYARRGEKVELPKRMVTIKEIELLEFQNTRPDGSGGRDPTGRETAYPRAKIRVVCSSGTYMRQLAVDLGDKLEVPAVAVELRRTRIGNYTLNHVQHVQKPPPATSESLTSQ